MAKELFCNGCDAEFIIRSKLKEGYYIMYCPYCGDTLSEDDGNIIDEPEAD